MELELAAKSVVGRRKRNEDAFALHPGLGLCVVSDGMGGYEGGNVASSLAVRAVVDFVERNARDPQGTWPIKACADRSHDENVLAAACAAAHRAIQERREGVLAMMGATIVIAWARDRKVVIAHVGDSRAYRVRAQAGGAAEALTRDHSAYEEMRAAGMVLPPRAEFVHKNQVTRALGIDGNAAADVRTLEVEPGDTLLLCSDGLYDPLDAAAIASSLRVDDLASGCEMLVRGAFELGSADNITAAAMRVKG